MALFFMVALQSSAPLVEIAIRNKVAGADCYQIESGKWILDLPRLSTSKEVSDLLGLSEVPTASHVVVSIRGYFGRAQPDLWEWLAARASRVNA